MSRIEFMKTVFIGSIMTVSICLQASAYKEDCPEGYLGRGWNVACFRASGSCGTNCSYTMDENGNLFITGQNAILSNVPINYQAADRIYISEGIVEIKSGVFAYQDVLKSINIPQSATIIGDNILYNNKTNAKVYCTATQVNNGLCVGSKLNSLYGSQITHYEIDEDKYIVYDSFDEDKQIVGIYDNSQDMQKDIITDFYEKKNSTTGRTDKYDGRGHFITSYIINPDGSTRIYDENGKLIGMKGKKIYTVEEATELVSKKGKNTFSIRYR